MSRECNSKMMIGCRVSDSKIFMSIEDIAGYAYENDLEYCSPTYDSNTEYWILGFEVDSIKVSDLDMAWVNDCRHKSDMFKELSGVDAELIGAVDIF